MPGLLNGFLPAKPPRPLALLHNCSKLLQAAIQGMLLVVLHLICKGLVGPILHAEAAIGHGTHLALPGFDDVTGSIKISLERACPSDCGARVVLVALRDSRLALVVFVVATMPTVHDTPGKLSPVACATLRRL